MSTVLVQVGNVLLYFSTLAAGFRLKTPLPPYLPPAEKARLRLLEKVESLSAIKRGGQGGARHLLFFSCQSLERLHLDYFLAEG